MAIIGREMRANSPRQAGPRRGRATSWPTQGARDKLAHAGGARQAGPRRGRVARSLARRAQMSKRVETWHVANMARAAYPPEGPEDTYGRGSYSPVAHQTATQPARNTLGRQRPRPWSGQTDPFSRPDRRG